MANPSISAKHPAIKAFYEQRDALTKQKVDYELAVREPFKALLEALARAHGWTLVVEQRVEGLKNVVRPDGTLRDATTLPRGYWEAKDIHDDLDAEIDKKFARGYPKTNIVFADTTRAVLVQRGERVGDYDLTQPEKLIKLLEQFFGYTEPNIAGFEQSMARFKQDTPELAKGLLDLIGKAHRDNKAFVAAYKTFYELCQTALNPNISRDAVDEMLIQHLLTERLMRTVFDNPDFGRRNAIAAEIETVIDALTSKSFSRKDFLGQLDYFYEAIEAAARGLSGFREKQAFINTVYERFFQGYAIKVADTHGIVYTPQPIVDFMCAAVEEVLRDEFNASLGDPDVCIIDPCTGTGNFIINLLRRMSERSPALLPDVYRNRLFANEVMLLPYYVASLNIEHAYYELTGHYEPFEGLCFVDTLDLAEGAQMKLAFMTERNSARVERQKSAPITVIIGNPPYNAKQQNENDNNKNRTYEVIDKRLRETYVSDSKATNKNRLSDAYIKFFRWATDRLLGRDGIVCYVSNNSFIDGISHDGMRKHLMQDFTRIYHFDMSGNARSEGDDRQKEGGNIFDDSIRVGVGITIAIRSSNHKDRKLFFHRVPDYASKEEKLTLLESYVAQNDVQRPLNTVQWSLLKPNAQNFWRGIENADSYSDMIPLGNRETKQAKQQNVEAIFKTYSLGLNTSRDAYVYNYDRTLLTEQVQDFVEAYNSEVDRYRRAGKPKDIDSFVKYSQIKWSRDLKLDLKRGNYAEYSEHKMRLSQYRPFNRRYVFFDRILNEEIYGLQKIFPAKNTDNLCVCVSFVGSERAFFSYVTQYIPNLAFVGGGGGTQAFPFYTYDEDGSNRRENITDWALAQFRAHYGDETISKWDIFYYVYGLLHHPSYRERYADNLKRELPRIPFINDSGLPSPSGTPRLGEGLGVRASSSPSGTPRLGEGLGVRADGVRANDVTAFRALADAGRTLAELHVGYESLAPYPLEYVWTAGKPASYRVEKMRLNKDRDAVQVNNTLTLRGIPPQAFDYRLGNRSALDWIIDQYQVSTDKRSGITSDPNRYSEDEQYIVRLVGQVTRVSVETAAIVKALPALAWS